MIPKFPDHYLFQNGTVFSVDRAKESVLKSVITQMTGSKEVANKIAALIAEKSFPPFTLVSHSELPFPGSPYVGVYNLKVEVNLAAFEMRKVILNSQQGIHVRVHACTHKGLPLQLTLTGQPVETRLEIHFPPKFVFFKEGTQHENQEMETLIRANYGSLASDPQISNYLSRCLASKLFQPFTLKKGKFSLRLEVLVDPVNTGIVNVTGQKFTAQVEAESDKGLPLLLTLEGEGS